MFSESASSSKKKGRHTKKKTKTTSHNSCRRSVLQNSVILTTKSRRETPKPQTTEETVQGPELEGPKFKQLSRFSRHARTKTRYQNLNPTEPKQSKTICWWGPGHRRSQWLLPSREPPHSRQHNKNQKRRKGPQKLCGPALNRLKGTN